MENAMNNCRPQNTGACQPGCDAKCRNTLGYAPQLSLAMAYVPDQEWTEIYDAPAALERGTIFKQLDKPFFGRRCG